MKSRIDTSQGSDKETLGFKFRYIFWNPQEKRLRSLVRIIYFLVIFVLSYLGLALTLGWIFNFASSNPLATIITSSFVLGALMNAVLPLGGIFIAFWFASRYIDKRPFTAFGFHLSKKWFLDFAFGLFLGIFLMAVAYGVETVVGWIKVIQTNYSSIPQVPFWVGLIMYLVFYLAVGFYEEMMMRGYVLRNLAEGLKSKGISSRWAVAVSLALSSIVFGLLHIANPDISVGAIVLLSLAGLFLGLGYVLTGNLGLSIGIHIAWNFAEGIIFGFPVSGVESEFNLLHINQSGPTLLTGGNFGPEAGMIGLLIILLGIGMVFLYVKLTHHIIALDSTLAEYPRPSEKQSKITP